MVEAFVGLLRWRFELAQRGKRRVGRPAGRRTRADRTHDAAGATPVGVVTLPAGPAELARRAVLAADGAYVLPFEVDELPARKGSKTGRSATQLQLDERRSWVARLRRQRYTIAEIATIMQVSYATVAKDLGWLATQWAEARDEEVDTYVNEEVARLDELEREAWRGYHRSTRDVVEEQEYEEAGGQFGGKSGTRKKTLPQPAGDARFLAIVAKSIELRARLRGLLDKDARATVAVGADGRPLPVEVTVKHEVVPPKRDVEPPPPLPERAT